MYLSLTTCLVVLSAFLVLTEARQYYNSRLLKLKKKKHFPEKNPVIPGGVKYGNKGRFPGIPHVPVHPGHTVVKGGIPHHVRQKYPVTKGGIHPGRKSSVFHDDFHQFDTLGGRPGFKGGLSHGNVHPKHPIRGDIPPVFRGKPDGILPIDGGIVHPIIPGPVNHGVKIPVDPVINGGIKPVIKDGKHPGVIDKINPGIIDKINPGIDLPSTGVIGVVNPKVVDPIGPVPNFDINLGDVGGINNEGFLDPINPGVVDKVNPVPGFINGPNPPIDVGIGPGNFEGGIVGSNWRGDLGRDFGSDPGSSVGFNGGNNFRGNFGRNFGPSFDPSFTTGGDNLPGRDPIIEGNFGLPPGVDRGNFGNPFTRNEFSFDAGNNFPGNPGSRGFLESGRNGIMNRFSGTGRQGSNSGFPNRFPGNFGGSGDVNSQWGV